MADRCFFYFFVGNSLPALLANPHLAGAFNLVSHAAVPQFGQTAPRSKC